MASRDASTPSQYPWPAALPQFLRRSKIDVIAKFGELEWEQRERLSQQAQDGATSSEYARLTGDHIAVRNRYINVEPFANNRVKLRVPDGINDYINASPIILGDRRFIATQGPKDTSTSHFYRMLAAETQSPAVVVMLTQTHETGREKCFKYFPDSPDTPLQLPPDSEFGDDLEGQVNLLSTEQDADCRCTIRRLRLRTRKPQQEGQPESPWQEKEIQHLLFTGWPDFSVPEGQNRQAMLNLITLSQKLNTSSKPEQNPRIVHCSAGVGRSGTFIALDYLLAQLKDGHLDFVPENSDPIAETVDVMRKQRMMMVQSEGQFVFLYDVLREAWLERYSSRQQANGGADASS